MTIPIYKPWIKRKDMDSVLGCMVEDSIGPGQKADDLCSKISSMIKASGGFAINEYARAVEIILKILDLGEEDEIIVSPLVSGVYYDVFNSLAVNYKIAEVNIENACVSLESLESLLNEHTKAIFINRPLGFIPEIEKIMEFGIPVVDDLSMGFYPFTDEEQEIVFGDIVIMSMDSESFISSATGAVVIANTKKYLSKIKKEVSILDSSYLLADMNAALGIVQCDSVFKNIETRKQIYDVYESSIMKTRHKTFHKDSDLAYPDFRFPVILESNVKDVVSYCMKKGIEVKPAFDNVFFQKDEKNEASYKNAEYLLLRTVHFPLYPSLGKKNVSQIAKILSTLP